MPIRPYLKGAVFAPDLISAMGTALEDICKLLESAKRSDVSKELVAAKIIELAQGGEKDPVVMHELVLNELGLAQLPTRLDLQSEKKPIETQTAQSQGRL